MKIPEGPDMESAHNQRVFCLTVILEVVVSWWVVLSTQHCGEFLAMAVLLYGTDTITIEPELLLIESDYAEGLISKMRNIHKSTPPSFRRRENAAKPLLRRRPPRVP